MLLVILLLVGLVVCIVLLTNESTRKAGFVVLGIGAAVLFALLMLVGVSWVAYERKSVARIDAMHQQAMSVEERRAGTASVDQVLGPRIDLEERSASSTDATAHPAVAVAATDSGGDEAAEPAAEAADAAPPSETTEAATDTAVDVGETSAAPAPSEAGAPANSEPPPAWLKQGATRTGDVWREIVVSDRYELRQDAELELERLMIVATGRVIDDVLGRPSWARAFVDEQHQYRHAERLLRDLDLRPGDIWSNYSVEEYTENARSVMDRPQYRWHVLLEYDQQDREDIVRRWQRHQSEERVTGVALVAAAVMGVLALAYGVLKFDTATKGYYTRRLIIGGAAVTMVVVALVMLRS